MENTTIVAGSTADDDTTTLNSMIILSWVIIVVVIGIFIVLGTQRVPRTKGKEWKYHAVYIIIVALIVWLCPIEIKQWIFSDLGVIIVGCVFPIYESLRALATPETSDDMEWLQYWCGQSVIYFLGAWLNDYHLVNDTLTLVWFQFEFFFFLWLLLPFTDGSTLVFDYITGPLLSPIIEPIAKQMGSWMTKLVMTVINASHLWALWAFFVFLNKDIKRFVTIAVGTVYPLLASMVAVTTPSPTDDTFWLTYWSCYGILFMIMDWLETWLGRIPGFYSIVIFATVYLMLPMFQGSDKIFRELLVPLVGLKEQLLLRDAAMVKYDLLKNIPIERQSELRTLIAQSFAQEESSSPSTSDNATTTTTTLTMNDTIQQARWTSPYKRKSSTSTSSIFPKTKETGTEEETMGLV